MPPETCPNCGADVPPHATTCPECGADAQTGWSEQARVDHLGLPDEEFDYQDFVGRELEPGRHKPYGVKWLWWAVALLLVVVLLAWWLR